MPCTHDITEREVAVMADGMCPICQMAEIKRLRTSLEKIKTYATAKRFLGRNQLIKDAVFAALSE